MKIIWYKFDWNFKIKIFARNYVRFNFTLAKQRIKLPWCCGWIYWVYRNLWIIIDWIVFVCGFELWRLCKQINKRTNFKYSNVRKKVKIEFVNIQIIIDKSYSLSIKWFWLLLTMSFEPEKEFVSFLHFLRSKSNLTFTLNFGIFGKFRIFR